MRLQSLSPQLSLGYDMHLGDFVTFVGPLGSGRTHNAL